MAFTFENHSTKLPLHYWLFLPQANVVMEVFWTVAATWGPKGASTRTAPHLSSPLTIISTWKLPGWLLRPPWVYWETSETPWAIKPSSGSLWQMLVRFLFSLTTYYLMISSCWVYKVCLHFPLNFLQQALQCEAGPCTGVCHWHHRQHVWGDHCCSSPGLLYHPESSPQPWAAWHLSACALPWPKWVCNNQLEFRVVTITIQELLWY